MLSKTLCIRNDAPWHKILSSKIILNAFVPFVQLEIEISELAILQFFHVYSQLITILLGLKTGMDAALFLLVIMCKDHADLHAVLILAYVPLE